MRTNQHAYKSSLICVTERIETEKKTCFNSFHVDASKTVTLAGWYMHESIARCLHGIFTILFLLNAKHASS